MSESENSNNKPNKSLDWLLDWRVIIAIWIFANGWVLLIAEPEMFQRVGSLGVAFVILLWTAGRLITRRYRDWIIRHISGVDELLKYDGVVRELDKMKIGKLIPKPEDQRSSKKISSEKLAAVVVVLGRSSRYGRSASSFEVAELFLLTASTIQWGYGDLFVIWIHGLLGS